MGVFCERDLGDESVAQVYDLRSLHRAGLLCRRLSGRFGFERFFGYRDVVYLNGIRMSIVYGVFAASRQHEGSAGCE